MCTCTKKSDVHPFRHHGKEEEFTEHSTESDGVREIRTRMETMTGAIQDLNTRMDNQKKVIVKFLENKFDSIELLLVKKQNSSLHKATVTDYTDQ